MTFLSMSSIIKEDLEPSPSSMLMIVQEEIVKLSPDEIKPRMLLVND